MALAATSTASVPPSRGHCSSSPSFQSRSIGGADPSPDTSIAGISKLVFVYGTLKRGFGNEWLMKELEREKHACFVANASTKLQFPLVCGPFQVPFLLDFPSQGHRVHGELYLVDQAGLIRLDELEGVSKGHYERRSILVQDISSKFREIKAEAYFACCSYARHMLRAPHLASYTSVQAATYVPRGKRPPGVTFLEHIQAWIDAAD